MKLLLIMRKGYSIHADHIQCLRNMGVELHLLTEVKNAEVDPRFTSVTWLDPNNSVVDKIQVAARLVREKQLARAITFQETDIVFTAEVNQLLGVSRINVEADCVARDKSCQRRFLGFA